VYSVEYSGKAGLGMALPTSPKYRRAFWNMTRTATQHQHRTSRSHACEKAKITDARVPKVLCPQRKMLCQ